MSTRPGIPWKLVVVIMIGIAALTAIAVPLYATGKPQFYGKYQRFAQRYESWKTSKHRNVTCIQCHVGPKDGVGYRASLVQEYYRTGAKARRPVVATLPPASAAACRGCHSEGRSFNLKRLASIPHPAHTDLTEERRDCVKCHKWVAHSEKYQEKHKKIVFTGICTSFGCHAGTKSQSECRWCHHTQSFAPSKWREMHPRVVDDRGSNGCFDYCHKVAQCRSCHIKGRNPFAEKGTAPKQLTGLIARHATPEWDAEHGKEAQQGKEKCFYCHGSVAACRDCHSRRPAFHGPKSTWLSRHQKLGKNKKRCLACHVAKECTDCHKVFKEGR